MPQFSAAFERTTSSRTRSTAPRPAPSSKRKLSSTAGEWRLSYFAILPGVNHPEGQARVTLALIALGDQIQHKLQLVLPSARNYFPQHSPGHGASAR